MVVNTPYRNGDDTEPGAVPGQYGGSNSGYNMAQAPTFNQLAQNGVGRPPAPGYSQVVATQPQSVQPMATGWVSGQATGQTSGQKVLPGTVPGYGGGAQPPTTAPQPTQGTAPQPATPSFEDALKSRFTPTGPQAPTFTAPSTTTTFNPSANPFTPGITSATNALLANPNPYLSDAVQSQYKQLAGNIDDQYDQNNQQIAEEMARRGLDASSIMGGRLADSNVQRRTAQTSLASDLLNGMAQTYGADQRSAITTAQGVGDDQFNQDYQTAQLRDALQSGDYNRALQTFVTNQAAQQSAFGQNEQALQDYLGYGQQSYQNQLSTAQMNATQQNQYLQQLLQLIGIA